MPEQDLKRVDFEPYFLAWNSVLHYPHPGVPQEIHGYSGNEAMVPCHQHKTCGGLVFAKEKYPPQVCPHCGLDTSTEIKSKAEPIEVDPETGLIPADKLSEVLRGERSS